MDTDIYNLTRELIFISRVNPYQTINVDSKIIVNHGTLHSYLTRTDYILALQNYISPTDENCKNQGENVKRTIDFVKEQITKSLSVISDNNHDESDRCSLLKTTLLAIGGIKALEVTYKNLDFIVSDLITLKLNILKVFKENDALITDQNIRDQIEKYNIEIENYNAGRK